jgi:hypothetical protein
VSIERVPPSRGGETPSQKLLVKGKLGTLAVIIPPGLVCSLYTDRQPKVSETTKSLLDYVMVEKSFRCLAFFSPLSVAAREPKEPLLAGGPFMGKRSPEIVALHGTTGALLENMIQGVSQGFSKRLVLKGVGYRARLSERGLELSVGYSHPVCVYPPSDLDIVLESPTSFTVRGLRKDRVADFAARVRSVRPPEPYKGKGIAYEGEVIRRKAGKSGKPGR